MIAALLLCFLALTNAQTCSTIHSWKVSGDLGGWASGLPSNGYSSSAAQANNYVMNKPTSSDSTLRVAWDKWASGGKTNAIYYVWYSTPKDWTSKNSVQISIYSDYPMSGVAIALKTGTNADDWVESSTKAINSGTWNTLTFNLDERTWKSQASGWAYTTNVPFKNYVKQLSVILIPSNDGYGEAFFNTVNLCSSSSTPTPTPTPTPRPTTPTPTPTPTPRPTTPTPTPTPRPTTPTPTPTPRPTTPTPTPTPRPTTPTPTPTPRPTTPTPTPTPRPTPSGFVRRNGAKFAIGNCDYFFAGTNNYYLIYKDSNSVVNVINDAAAMKLNVIRAWAFLDIGNLGGPKENIYFQSFESGTTKYNDGATGLVKLDFVLDEARKKNIKLLLPFVNNWQEFGGMDQYVNWRGKSYHDDFYTDAQIKQDFKNWINHLVTRTNSINGIKYKDDPTIFAWELANEPRCIGSGNKGASSSCNGQRIVTWAREMSDYVKSIDSNHMVAVGDEGFFSGGSSWIYDGSTGDFKGLVALPNIDFGTVHLYPSHWGKSWEWGNDWILEHYNAARDANKPVIIEEFGWHKDNRVNVYTSWINTIQTSGVAGDLYWMLASRLSDGSLYSDYDGFTVYNDVNDGSRQIIVNHAIDMSSRTTSCFASIISDTAIEFNDTSSPIVDNSASLSTGTIVGIAVACCAVVVVIASVAGYIVYKKKIEAIESF